MEDIPLQMSQASYSQHIPCSYLWDLVRKNENRKGMLLLDNRGVHGLFDYLSLLLTSREQMRILIISSPQHIPYILNTVSNNSILIHTDPRCHLQQMHLLLSFDQATDNLSHLRNIDSVLVIDAHELRYSKYESNGLFRFLASRKKIILTSNILLVSSPFDLYPLIHIISPYRIDSGAYQEKFCKTSENWEQLHEILLECGLFLIGKSLPLQKIRAHVVHINEPKSKRNLSKREPENSWGCSSAGGCHGQQLKGPLEFVELLLNQHTERKVVIVCFDKKTAGLMVSKLWQWQSRTIVVVAQQAQEYFEMIETSFQLAVVLGLPVSEEHMVCVKGIMCNCQEIYLLDRQISSYEEAKIRRFDRWLQMHERILDGNNNGRNLEVDHQKIIQFKVSNDPKIKGSLFAATTPTSSQQDFHVKLLDCADDIEDIENISQIERKQLLDNFEFSQKNQLKNDNIDEFYSRDDENVTQHVNNNNTKHVINNKLNVNTCASALSTWSTNTNNTNNSRTQSDYSAILPNAMGASAAALNDDEPAAVDSQTILFQDIIAALQEHTIHDRAIKEENCIIDHSQKSNGQKGKQNDKQEEFIEIEAGDDEQFFQRYEKEMMMLKKAQCSRQGQIASKRQLPIKENDRSSPLRITNNNNRQRTHIFIGSQNNSREYAQQSQQQQLWQQQQQQQQQQPLDLENDLNHSFIESNRRGYLDSRTPVSTPNTQYPLSSLSHFLAGIGEEQPQQQLSQLQGQQQQIQQQSGSQSQQQQIALKQPHVFLKRTSGKPAQIAIDTLLKMEDTDAGLMMMKMTSKQKPKKKRRNIIIDSNSFQELQLSGYLKEFPSDFVATLAGKRKKMKRTNQLIMRPSKLIQSKVIVISDEENQQDCEEGGNVMEGMASEREENSSSGSNVPIKVIVRKNRKKE